MKTLRFLLLVVTALSAQPPAQVREYVTADTYTRYELLAPETNSFYIVYEVTETRPGAKYHFNQIRPGSEASDESVTDRATGKPLEFGVITGKKAKEEGAEAADRLADDASYIRVKLAHPVPEKGEARILIKKTYKDKASYFADGDRITFARGLGIPRNSVVLPLGYQLVSVNIPVQTATESDGRVRVSFLNTSPGEAPLKIVAKRAAKLTASAPASERAHQDREILYELQDPETHAFRIMHDYTESRAGTKAYLNVVRTGSHVKDPASIDLDTGEPLKWEVISGAEVKKRQIGNERMEDNAEVVVTWYAAPIAAGGSTRVRLMETYEDPSGYTVKNGELVFDRTFGRPRNLVALPPGWVLTESVCPAIISTLPDGRVLLTFLNPRNDEVHVILHARKN
jgi:hypothetical protein